MYHNGLTWAGQSNRRPPRSRRIGVANMARLRHITDDLMLAVEQGVDLPELFVVAARQLDKLVGEIEGRGAQRVPQRYEIRIEQRG